MFTGTYENSIDNKNRMIVPSKYRNQLGGKCMLARGFDTCLYIYTMEDWDELGKDAKASSDGSGYAAVHPGVLFHRIH